jgi:hypothetical protein
MINRCIIVSISIITASLHGMKEPVELTNLSQDPLPVNAYKSLSEKTVDNIDEQQSILLRIDNPTHEYDIEKLGKTAAIGGVTSAITFSAGTCIGAVGGHCMGYTAEAVVCNAGFLCADGLFSGLCFFCPFFLSNGPDICRAFYDTYNGQPIDGDL